MSTEAGDSLRPSSVTYKSIVAYDGTAFEGFQRQRGEIRTIQADLEAALTALGWRGRSLLAAGRTDRGVHAEGQVISFQLDWGHSLQDLTRALNVHLPMDIAIRDCQRALEGFHPRYSAKRRHYRYSVFVDPLRQPLAERYALRLKEAPELKRMQRAAKSLVGERDYRVFGPAPKAGGTTVRKVFESRWQKGEEGLIFDIKANAFLQHMVRRITAVLLEVGYGRLTLAEFEALVNTPGARWEGALAPPCGLSLIAVEY